VDNGYFGENLKNVFRESRSGTFSFPINITVLFAESFPFPCQEVILFIEFSSTVHSTGKSEFETHLKNSPIFGSYPALLHPKQIIPFSSRINEIPPFTKLWTTL
jgi:hypothetical protein